MVISIQAAVPDTTSTPDRVWATLLSSPSYLAATLVLDHSLKKQGSQYPLVVFAPPNLPTTVRKVVKKAGIAIKDIEYVLPSVARDKTFPKFDQRFADTWTKLAVFSLEEYERVILLDSDMLCVRNMDELMTMHLPQGHIAAAHACTCNPRKHTHYPSDWIPMNCAHTQAQKTQPVRISPSSRPTHHLLNSGLVILEPSAELFKSMLHALDTNPAVADFVFPDQDFLAMYFENKWTPLGYQYNALKTLRDCHKAMWRDEDVKLVHYIMEKPWNSRPDSPDALERDRYLSRWWWAEYEEVALEWKGKKELAAIEKNVAGPNPLQVKAGTVNGAANAHTSEGSSEEEKQKSVV